jgi:putative OPT family oligopeptide transporter
MPHDDPQVMTRLPENAYRELKPGETYTPMVPPGVRAPEITIRSIVVGLLMNIVFSAAATYVALKVGQGIETAIPISIVAIGVSGILATLGLRRSSLIENVNLLAIGTTSGIVAGGTVFTMPAIYILHLQDKLHMSGGLLFLQIFLVPFLGAVLGVIFLVPFRRYFVKQMHGKLPFPEATATNEILVSGAGGNVVQIMVLFYAFIIGFMYNGVSQVLRLFTETFSTAALAVQQYPFWDKLTHSTKAIFSMGTGAEFLGLGFIIGVRYASIILAGSFLSWFVIIPLLAPLDLEQLKLLNPAVVGTAAGDIFKAIPRNIGIGCIFAAGIISILKMSGVIVTALRQAIAALFAGGSADEGDRTDKDISYPMLALLGIATAAGIFLYFRFVAMAGLTDAWRLSIIALGLSLVVSFLFTTVSAWAIATISTTPISGMTVTTIIITAVALLAAGLPKGDEGMLIVLLVGGVVASALSMAGTLVTEFKISYWLGGTPRRVQWAAIIASLLASALVTATIMLFAKDPGYDAAVSPNAFKAPQANLMASALQSFVGTGTVPWVLYGVGVVIAVLINMLKVSPLAFGLGMYLPMELNAPILAGAIVSWFVDRSSKKPGVKKARNDQGILVASGLIAGAAILGVCRNLLISFDATKQFVDNFDLSAKLGTGENADILSNWIGLAAFVGLCIFVYLNCLIARPPKDELGGPPAPVSGQ